MVWVAIAKFCLQERAILLIWLLSYCRHHTVVILREVWTPESCFIERHKDDVPHPLSTLTSTHRWTQCISAVGIHKRGHRRERTSRIENCYSFPRKCRGKYECFSYDMLYIGQLKPYLIRIRYVQNFLLNINLIILFVVFVFCIV